MLCWLINRRLTAVERNFDYDMNYARDILNASLPAFWRFSKIFGIAAHREDVPREAWFAAKIAATLSEDCGPCTQLVVTMAEREGVSPATLRAILAADEKALPPDAALGFRFARAVLSRDIAAADVLRAEILDRWGRRALVSLALTIASARVFPAVKYALGHGRACMQVRVAGAAAPFIRHQSRP